jgi:peptide-methionine (S)-S-oxide reductase
MTFLEKATFGGGCFWGMQKWFKKEFPKLKSTTVGYAGGTKENPTYKEVCKGNTGHAEALQVEYDPKEVSYRDLVYFFFRIHDPTTPNRQGNDIGPQYRSVIFYHTKEQEQIAKEVKLEIEKLGKWKNPIVTEIVPATTFYRAEDYHQDYLEKNPGGYCNHKKYW